MVMTRPAPTSARPPAPAAPAPDGKGAKLRGMSYDEGADALTPPENKPGATKPEGKAEKELTPREVLDAWDINRTEGLSTTWIASLQGLLGVLTTGISTKELVVALAHFQAERGFKGKHGRGQLKSSVRSWLVSQLPELATVPQKSEAKDLKAANASGNTNAPEDEALKQLGKGGYPKYVAGFKSMTFLGQPVTGHPEFLGRLENARAYLKTKFEGQSDAELGQTLGIIRTSHFRASSATSDQMYHGLGYALDVNPVQNNWNYGRGNRGTKMSDVMKHVGDLFGESMIRTSGDMSKAAKNGTTEEMFDKLAASNQALQRYRAFASDEAALEAHLQSDKAPTKAKSKNAKGWMKTIADDEKWLAKSMAAGVKDKGSAGFMDFQKELVVALRDAGGLRWGGADLGGDNGDLMHFDGHTIDQARTIRKKTGDVRKAAAEQKAAATAG